MEEWRQWEDMIHVINRAGSKWPLTAQCADIVQPIAHRHWTLEQYRDAHIDLKYDSTLRLRLLNNLPRKQQEARILPARRGDMLNEAGRPAGLPAASWRPRRH